MASNYKENYVNGVVICHGKSEWLMSKHISSNLHLNVKSYAKDKGKHSIQITSLKTLLTTKPFNKQSTFVAEYPVEEVGKGNKEETGQFSIVYHHGYGRLYRTAEKGLFLQENV